MSIPPEPTTLDVIKTKGWKAIVDKAFDPSGNLNFSALSPDEQTVFAARELYGEIYNGGLGQFFVNSSGERWEQAVAALKKIGASALALLLQNTAERVIEEESQWDEDTDYRLNLLFDEFEEWDLSWFNVVDEAFMDELPYINALIVRFVAERGLPE